MNGISFLLLFLQALEVFSGLTSTNQIDSENIIQPAEYSWIAQLRYKRGYNPKCKGTVISTRHVLTAAQCVTDELIEVHLGQFTRDPICRYSTSECNFYRVFQVANTTVDDQYNEIALITLTEEIPLGPTLQRICLPFRMPQLTEVGYTLFINLNELTAKQAVIIPLLAKIECELQNGFMMCTGVFAATANNQITTCEGIFSRPRRSPLNRRKMLVEGIQSYFQSDNRANTNSSTIYSRVRNWFLWIKEKFQNYLYKGRIGSLIKIEKASFKPNSSTNSKPSITTECTSSPKPLVVEYQLPTDCGYSPIYPRELIAGGNKIEPDEFTWLASLVYEKNESAFGHCSGSVISSRYVLTAARCVNNNTHANLGKVVGVRLGDFKKEPFCDYGTEGCGNYQYFPIESFKIHENYKNYTPNSKRMNDIALLKLERDIVFGDKMKPICLPFGENNNIEKPEDDSFLTVAGWWTTTFPRDVIAKRSEAVAFWNTTGCMEADRDKNTQICGVKPGTSPCTTEFGSPLMNMFERRRMVLEGIAYDGVVSGCPGTDVGTLYTRVREYGEWIKTSIELLETTSSNGKIPEKNYGFITSLFNISRNWQHW